MAQNFRTLGIHVLQLLILVGGGFYLLFCSALYFFQERLLFYPSPLPQRLVYPFRTRFEEHFIPVPGARLNAVLFRAEAPKGLVIFFHGNAGNMVMWEPAAGSFVQAGYDTLMVDYRGYGKSDGVIQSEAQLLQDGESVYRWALDRYAEDRIVLCGRSIGSGIAAYLTAEHQPKTLILQSAYYSLLDMKRRLYPFVPNFLLRYPLRTDLWLARVRCPVFLIHGRRDTLIPFDSSERLLAKIPGEKRLFAVDEAGHDDLADYPSYDHALGISLGPRSSSPS